MTSSQLASHTIFTSVKVTWVLQGSSEGATAELFRTFQGVIVPKDLQCIAVCEAEVSSDIQYKYHSTAEWACCRVADSHPPTNEPCRQTLLLHGRPRLSYREHHWIAPMRLTAAQPGPWLRPVNLQPLSEQTKTDPAGPRDILPTQENHETIKNEFHSQYHHQRRTETQEGSKGPRAPRLSRS